MSAIGVASVSLVFPIMDAPPPTSQVGIAVVTTIPITISRTSAFQAGTASVRWKKVAVASALIWLALTEDAGGAAIDFKRRALRPAKVAMATPTQSRPMALGIMEADQKAYAEAMSSGSR
jgi:hypothetical protein